MRERWTDNGRGILYIETEKLYIQISSKASKNYRVVESNWTLSFFLKTNYAFRIYTDFRGTLEEAMGKAEAMVYGLYESTKEII